MSVVRTEAYRAALAYAGARPFDWAVREIPASRSNGRPAYKVMVRFVGEARGRHVATVVFG